MESQHIPVLLDEVLNYLSPNQGESYLDLTAGYGGHATAVLERTLNGSQTILLDRDQNAIDFLMPKFKDGVKFICSDFYTGAKNLRQEGKQFDLILADLGVASPHLNNASRGFSFMANGPLDMRMDQQQELTADKIVNEYNEEQLAEILRNYGEEPRARKIAHSIVANRPIRSTEALAKIVALAKPGQAKAKRRINPATRTFQALRIAVNDELNLLQQALPVWIDLLAPGGRIVVISFHSLEDRIVKQFLADRAGNRYDAELKLLTPRPVTSKPTELVSNPRARSAKLRAAVKIKTKEGATLHAYTGKK